MSRSVLAAAENVVGEQHVVGHPGVHEDLDLAELLAGDADGARRHLHLADGGDLVRLDVRAVADAVAGEVRLHAADVVLHDVQVDGDGGRVELADRGHGSLLSLRFHSSQGRAIVPAMEASARRASSGLEIRDAAAQGHRLRLQARVDLGVDAAEDRDRQPLADHHHAVAAHEHDRRAPSVRASASPRAGVAHQHVGRRRRGARGCRTPARRRRGTRSCDRAAAAAPRSTPNGITEGEWLCTIARTSGRAR